MEAPEWYKLRNDRTQRVDSIVLDSLAKRIGIHIRPESVETYSGQVLALLTVNILARWCRRIAVQMPEDAFSLIPGRMDSLKHLLEKTMVEADPFGEFIFNNLSAESCDIIVDLGGNGHKLKGDCFWAYADGWIGGYGYGKVPDNVTRNDSFIPVGSCFAACQLNSAIFRHYLQITPAHYFQKWYSLFDFQSSESATGLANPAIREEISIARLWQIGCGAVGSSFDYLISLMKVFGIIHTVDFDQVSVPNTSSSLLFTGRDALDEIKKIAACERVLSLNPILKPIPLDGDFDDFIRAGNLEKNYPDIILCFANERAIWPSIQHNCPPLVLHATTTRNWGINFGRHIPFKEWCIVCRFGMIQLNSTPICANGSIQNEQREEEILGTLPFLAPAAAAHVLAEILKVNMGIDYPCNKNFLQFSLKNNGLSFQTQQLSPKPDCPVCSLQDIRDYPEKFHRSLWR